MPPNGPHHAVEPLGRRVATHRVRIGLTQQLLADRIAMSRAAVSHLESGLSVASERTVTLLAGVFQVEPHELVEATDYPLAKAERLPLVTARYSEADMVLALLENDLNWCERLGDCAPRVLVVNEWRGRLARLAAKVVDPHERLRIENARRRLA